MKKKLLLSTFLTLLVTGCIANNENTPEVTENPQTSIEPTEETNETNGIVFKYVLSAKIKQ